MSVRAMGLPTIEYWSRGLKGGRSGGVNFAASCASSPKVAVRFEPV
jgi:hypothetical protein